MRISFEMLILSFIEGGKLIRTKTRILQLQNSRRSYFPNIEMNFLGESLSKFCMQGVHLQLYTPRYIVTNIAIYAYYNVTMYAFSSVTI